jgi:hypothetical protein
VFVCRAIDVSTLEDSPLPENAFTVPVALRRTALWVIGAAFIVSLVLLMGRIWDPNPDSDPTKMELAYLLVAFAVAFGICKLEWEKFQFRITKIGPVELHQIVSTQANEHVSDIAELRTRIEALEAARTTVKKGVVDKDKFSQREDLKGLLENFLSTHAPWPSRQPELRTGVQGKGGLRN